ncbi:MAG: hypothetical protein MJ081_06740 [Ruminococcus sp.]|nr:hypothetical protein [Ruminococcus sp.]
MTEYLTKYMNTVSERIAKCSDMNELNSIMSEHMDKIQFMQHERLVHFLVTMMFAVILSIFTAVLMIKDVIGALLLVTIILVLLIFYIKHYYFLENTVQKMYRVYDELLALEKKLKGEEYEEKGNS